MATFCLRNVIVRGQCLPSVYPHVMLKPRRNRPRTIISRACARVTRGRPRLVQLHSSASWCVQKSHHISLLMLTLDSRGVFGSDNNSYLHFVPRVLHFSAIHLSSVLVVLNQQCSRDLLAVWDAVQHRSETELR